MGVEIEYISQTDEHRLAEFDGLFILTTTNIDHYTYKMAKKAENLGIMAIDDPVSMLRCTNKVYLADLFRSHHVATPKTILLHKGNSEHVEHAIAELGFPMVVKIPDGSFSRGIEKVKTVDELKISLAKLFGESTLLIVQEFIPTSYDWRIGILGGKAMYACRYYMVKNHWQIYLHGQKNSQSGNFDCLPTFEVPPDVLKTAMRATSLIGNGLYGVDLKEVDGKGVVIEVNDNPNIDGGVEDGYLGMTLYETIMAEFVHRMSKRRNPQV